MHGGLVGVAHRPAVNRQAVQGVLAEHVQQARKLRLVGEADAALDGEAPPDRGAQRLQEGVHPFRMAQQPAAGILAADHRRGAAEVEIDARNRQPLQLAGAAQQGGQILADHLREDRNAGFVLGDGPDRLGIEPGIRRDAEVLGDEQVRPAIAGHQPHERQVRDVLHGREDKGGTVAGQKIAHPGRYQGCGPPATGKLGPGGAKNSRNRLPSAPQRRQMRRKLSW